MKKLFVWGFAPALLIASLLSSALYAATPEGVLLDRALAGVVSDIGWCCHQSAEAEAPAQAAAADRELPGGGEAAILSRTEAGRSMQSSGSVPIAHNADTAARLLLGGAAVSTGFS